MAPVLLEEVAQNLNIVDNRLQWTFEDEIDKNEKLKREDVTSLRNFCFSLPKVDPSTITVEVLTALLHCSDYNLDRAQIVATKYFQTRTTTPEVFLNRRVDNDDIQSALEVGYFWSFRQQTPEGYRLVLQRLRQTDPVLFHYPSSSKVQFLTLDSCIHEHPTCPGYVFIYDMNGVAMGHMFRWSIFLTRKIMKYIHEGIPLKIQQIHFVNCNSITPKIMRMLKPFISQELWDMLKFHAPDDFEEFWKHLPKEYLPREHGGHLPDLETLHKEHIDWLKLMQPKVDNEISK